MASAQKRPNRKWLGRYRGPDGRERSKAFGRKQDALRWAREQEDQVRSLGWTDPARAKVTVEDIAAPWLANKEIKPKTRASYESLLSTCVLPRWGRTRLDQITTGAVRSWVASMTGAKGRLLSASRRRQAYHLLTSILDSAVEDGRLPRNPARPAEQRGRRSGFLPAVPAGKAHRYLRHDELLRLADAAGAYRTLVLVLGYCGLRWGEAAALRVRNIDFLKGRLFVESSLAEVNGVVMFGTTKTHATRTVPIPSFLLEDLSAQVVGFGPDDLVFTSPKGAPLRSANFRRDVFDPAVRSAGLDGLTPHGLRHAAASLAVSSGASVKAVQRMLGHKDAAMTLNVYADLFDDELDDVAGRMNEAVSRARADSVRTGDLGRVLALPQPEVALAL
jgi:integrase